MRANGKSRETAVEVAKRTAAAPIGSSYRPS
jgi:hypothetical protein